MSCNVGEEVWKGKSVVSLCGAISGEDRFRHKLSVFKTTLDVVSLVRSPGVGGYGLALTTCYGMTYISANNCSLEYLGSKVKIVLIEYAQKYKVAYIDIVIPNTIDELILTSLKAKKQLSETVLGDDVKKYL